MISRSTFLDIRERFGLWASWAVWAEAGVKPKDNMGDLSVFDLERNPGVLNELHADAILVGLNFSRGQSRIWGNFHDPRPVATDYKTRHALKGTWLWGAYMTDVIKDKVEKHAGSLVRYLGAHPDVARSNIEILREEISALGVDDPLLVAFGRDAEILLRRHLGGFFRIVGIPHYATYISMEDYRLRVSAATGSRLPVRS